jgi:hypothetical protein
MKKRVIKFISVLLITSNCFAQNKENDYAKYQNSLLIVV